MLEDPGELRRHPLDLVLVEAEPRKARDVEDLVAIDHRPRIVGAATGSRRNEKRPAGRMAGRPSRVLSSATQPAGGGWFRRRRRRGSPRFCRRSPGGEGGALLLHGLVAAVGDAAGGDQPEEDADHADD